MLAWLGYLCAGVLGLAVLLVAVIVISTMIRYRRSPLWQWRQKVLQLQARADAEVIAAREMLGKLPPLEPSREEAIKQACLREYLAEHPIQALENYPGIGRGTLAKLRRAGYRTLGNLSGTNWSVRDLGKKRTADVQSAVRDLLEKIRVAFETPGTPEASLLRERLQAQRAQGSEAGARALARLVEAQKVLDYLEPLVEIARSVNLRTHLAEREGNMPLGLVLEAQLPDVDAILQAAEEEAARGSTPRAGRMSQYRIIRPPAEDIFIDTQRPRVAPRPASGPPLRPARSEPVADLFQTAPSNAPPAPAEPPPPARPASVADHRAALEIAPDAPLTADLIRRQYRLLSERYREEKFTAAGPEFVDLARRKRETAQASALALLQPLGEPLEPTPPPVAEPELRPNNDLDAIFGR